MPLMTHTRFIKTLSQAIQAKDKRTQNDAIMALIAFSRDVQTILNADAKRRAADQLADEIARSLT